MQKNASYLQTEQDNLGNIILPELISSSLVFFRQLSEKQFENVVQTCFWHFITQFSPNIPSFVKNQFNTPFIKHKNPMEACISFLIQTLKVPTQTELDLIADDVEYTKQDTKTNNRKSRGGRSGARDTFRQSIYKRRAEKKQQQALAAGVNLFQIPDAKILASIPEPNTEDFSSLFIDALNQCIQILIHKRLFSDFVSKNVLPEESHPHLTLFNVNSSVLEKKHLDDFLDSMNMN